MALECLAARRVRGGAISISRRRQSGELTLHGEVSERWRPSTRREPKRAAAPRVRSSLALLALLPLRPDRNVLAFWSALLHSGLGTPREVFGALLASREFRDTISPLLRLYAVAFVRPPDHAGLTYWLGRRLSGTPLEAVADAFVTSHEMDRLYGTLDDEAFAYRVFLHAMGEAPQPPALRAWTSRLAEGRITRGQMLVGFSRHPAFVRKSHDALQVTLLFLLLLRRSPDPVGLDYFVDTLREAGLDRAFAAMLDSDECRRAIGPGNLANA